MYPFFYSFLEGKAISELFINEQIRAKEVRVIGIEGDQLGVMSIQDARKIAEDEGVDLVMIAPTAKPPVCRVVDYGKFKYEQLRKEKEARKKQKTVEIKEIRLSPNIDTNDLETELRSHFVSADVRWHIWEPAFTFSQILQRHFLMLRL